MKYKSIYVAATSQHVGKTTSTLGLVATFIAKGLKVGYCKPVGQKSLTYKNVEVDKDAILFADLMNFPIHPDMHSPVILGKGATTAFIDQPELFDFANRVQQAAKQLEAENELVIYEGTGHPGVGSIVNLSNAVVAKMINAGVIMIVEGGIGSTIDMLSLCLAKFQMEKVPIIGVIINKVKPEKIDKVEYYVGKFLEERNLPLLGVLPYDRSLAFPLIRTVAKAVRGNVEINEHKTENKVADILAGSILNLGEFENPKDLLLVVAADRLDVSLEKIHKLSVKAGLEQSPLSGIVATGKGEIRGISLDYINEYQIPVIRTKLDTYGSVLKISRIEVKINLSTPWKVARAIELIKENVRTEDILEEVS